MMKKFDEKEKNKYEIVVPGQYLGPTDEYKCGEGTYVRFCQIYANRAGYKTVEKMNENVRFPLKYLLILFYFSRDGISFSNN